MADKRFIYCSGLIGLLCLLALTGVGTSLRADSPDQAGLVVAFGDGSYIARCLELGESQITSYDLLLRAGLDVEAAVSGGMGALVCGIEEVGCPATNCMCDYPPNYWSYWHLAGEEWIYSQAGASGYLVRPGDVEGWSWGEGSPPVVVQLEQICPPPATDTPTPSATWTPSPVPTSTDTPVPSPTWTPAPSHTPTAIPPTATQVLANTPLPTATATLAPTSTGAPAVTATAARTKTPTPTTEPSHTPPIATQATVPPAYPTAAASSTPVENVPSPPPLATATQIVASAMPVPTQIAVATRSLTAEQTVVPIASAQGTSTTNVMSRLPALLAVSAGLAYVFFLFLVLLLATFYLVVKLRQR